MEKLQIKNGELGMGNGEWGIGNWEWRIAEELLSIYGSPLYVYDALSLRETIKRITQAVPYPRTQFRFASVTNGNISLLKIFRECGWGLHANTPGDIYLGLKAGFDPSEIVYSGSNLNLPEMIKILNWGITTLNLDSIAQLKLLCEIWGERSGELHLGLRLNLPEITGDSRIGVSPEDFAKAIAITSKSKLKLTGLHFYRGTGTNATKAFTQVIETVIATAQQLPDWEYLDFGGGFGYPYHHFGAAFDWEEFGAALTDSIKSLKKEIDLVIEPGRAAIAGCGILLAKVVSIKWQEEKQIVGVDTTVGNLSVPSVHGGYREIITSQLSTVNGQQSKVYTTDVCGNTTYSRDYLGKNCQLPALEIGDIIAILDVGAYGYAMSSHFLHRPRPAEVLLENNTHHLIRKREDYSTLLENQLF
ncbi:MAG: alanine racemase [Scytonematopsis contorta HA4267-MV1]|jgi:diaminopimelate decarboxylase|nr:alanine racemase [Scytonematopsis contorta HA4267-MV1]